MGTREISYPAGVYDSYRQLRVPQGRRQEVLIPAGGLDHYQRTGHRFQAPDQPMHTHAIVGFRPNFTIWSHSNLEALLRHIDPDKRLPLCHVDLLRQRSFPALRNPTWRLSPVMQLYGLSIGPNRDATIQLSDGLSEP